MMDRKLDLERFLQIINWSTYNAPANVGKVYKEGIKRMYSMFYKYVFT